MLSSSRPDDAAGKSAHSERCGDMPTFQEFLFGTFFVDKRGSLSKTSEKEYRGQYDCHCKKYLADMALDQIGHSDVQRAISDCKTYWSAKNTRDFISSVLGYAQKGCRKIDSNVARDTFIYPQKPFKRSGHQGVVLQSFEEIVNFILRIHEARPGSAIDRAVILSGCFGLRPGETFGVDNADLHMNDKYIEVIKANSAFSNVTTMKGPKTPVSQRSLPIYDFAATLIEDVGFRGAPDDPFVQNMYGRRCSATHMHDYLARARIKLDLPDVTFESLRHSFGTACILSGMSVPALQAWLGHASPVTTMKDYCNPNYKALVSDSEVISSMMTDPNDKTVIWNKDHDAINYVKILKEVLEAGNLTQEIESMVKSAIHLELKRAGLTA